MKLLQGDCLELMKDIPDGSVDMVLTDLPYGTTKCKWDDVIPFEPLWHQLKRITKENSAIVLFAKQPFTTKLINSNITDFKYCLVWEKDNHDNPMMAKRRYLNITEDIAIFYKKQCTYNPQGLIEVNKVTKQGRGKSLSQANERSGQYFQQYTNYPKNIRKHRRDKPQLHPTQKPITLLEELVLTFSNKGDTIIDITMGSGSTGVACLNTNRNFIGMELDETYFSIAKERIENHEVAE